MRSNCFLRNHTGKPNSPEVCARNYLNVDDYLLARHKRNRFKTIARNLMKGKLSMTATESSKPMKDRNSPIADANFVMAGGSQLLENLIKSNSIAMKSSFEITQEML